MFDEFGEGGEDYLDETNNGPSKLTQSSFHIALILILATVSAIFLDCISIASPLLL